MLRKNFRNVFLDVCSEIKDILLNSFGRKYLCLENTSGHIVINFDGRLVLTNSSVNDVMDFAITNIGEAPPICCNVSYLAGDLCTSSKFGPTRLRI